MTSSLRPMRVGEILDRTFQIYRARFLTFAVIALLPTIGGMVFLLAGHLFEGFVSQTTLPYAARERIVGLRSLVSADSVESFLSLLVFPVFAYCVSEILIGEQPELRAAIQACFTRLRSLLFLTSLTWAVSFGIGRLLLQVPRIKRLELFATLGLYDRSNVGAGISFLILKWVGSFVLAAAVSLSMPAWLLERSSAGSAIRRGWTLARRRYGAILMAWLIRSVLIWMFSVCFSFVLYLVFTAIKVTPQAYSNYAILRGAAIYLPSRLSAILIRPVFAIAITLIYYDQRIRLEGYDIEWMMEAAGMNTLSPETPNVSQQETPLEESQR